MVKKAITLTKAVKANYVRRESAVGHSEIDGVLLPCLCEKFVTKLLSKPLDLWLELANGSFGEELADCRTAIAVQVVFDCAKAGLFTISELISIEVRVQEIPKRP